MATSQKRPCSRCEKGSGIFTCDGCQKSFCRKHSDEHRQELAMQMDSIGQEHDVLQRDIDSDAITHPLLSRVDVWERESIKKIQQAAKQARIDLSQLIDETKEKHKTTMNILTKELHASRESEDYTEIDLNKWVDQLNKIRQELEQPNNTHVLDDDDDDDDDQKSVIRLIKVRSSQCIRSSGQLNRASNQNSQNNQSAMSINQERFNVKHERIMLTENDLVATNVGPTLEYCHVYVFGINSYSTGTHHILFRIEKIYMKSLFFGIVTSNEVKPSSDMSSTTSANGWWLNSNTVVNCVFAERLPLVNILDGDGVIMTIDCDQKQIYHEYYRTKERFQLPIDIQKCPFPWQIMVGLLRAGDCIRIVRQIPF